MACRKVSTVCLLLFVLTGFDGKWRVLPLGDGSSCEVSHELSMKPLLPIPPPISYYTSSVLEKEVSWCCRSVEERAMCFFRISRWDGESLCKD